MHESSNQRYVMEVGGQSVGLLVFDHSRYTFYAANKAAQRAVDAVVRPKLKRKFEGKP